MRIAARTDIGLVRENNQDSYTAGELCEGTAFAVVCDGMGGAAEGALASRSAVKVIREKLSSGFSEGMSDIAVKSLLISALENANKYIYELSLTKEEYEGMGTTAVAAIVSGGFVYIAHVGDSRAYMTCGGRITQLTRDHSVIQRMIENGEITPQEAKDHPSRHIITRALGVDSEVRVDFCQEPFDDGSLLILCTDGLTNSVKEDDIFNLSGSVRFYDVANSLVDYANKIDGADNVTVVAVSK